MDKSKTYYIKKALPLVGLILFIAILRKIDFDRLMIVYANSQLQLMFIGLVVCLIAFIGKAFRYYFLIISQDVKITLYDAILIFFQSSFWGLISPGRLGELSKIIYVKKHSNLLAKSITNPFLDRILDLVAIVIFLAIAIMEMDFKGNLKLLSLLTVCLIFLFLVVLSLKHMLNLDRFKSIRSVHAILSEFLFLKNKFLLVTSTMAIQLVYYAGMFLLSKSIGITCDFVFIIYCVCLANIMAAIPITVAGLGTRDALLILLFQNAHISNEYAIAFSSLFVVVYLIMIMFSYGFIMVGTLWENRMINPHTN